MRPVHNNGDGTFSPYVDHDHVRQAFTWMNTTPERLMLTEVGSFSTEHSYGAPAFFKPSVHEVLEQVPEAFVGFQYFTIEPAGGGRAPGCFTADSNRHVATVRVYAPSPWLQRFRITDELDAQADTFTGPSWSV